MTASQQSRRAPRAGRPGKHPGHSEGPYEQDPSGPYSAVSNRELAKVVDFIEQLEAETEQALSIKRGYSEMRMQSTLMRNHLEGKLTTRSSLVAHSGLTYGTAMRGINSLIERQLIVKRCRTSTGKSFSLHPTEKMLQEWQELTRRIHSLRHVTFDDPEPARQQPADYFFGASYARSHALPPMSVLGTSLPIRQSLRILAHADPTFMAMRGLKKQFETQLGAPIRTRAMSIDRLREEILQNGRRKVSNYDLIACDLPWFGEMADQGHFLPLDSFMQRSQLDVADFHPEALASTRYRGQHYGVPVQTTPELLVYRRDVLASRGLEPPATIEDTLSAARALHSPFSDGMAGIAWNAARGTPLGHSFLFVLSAFGQPIFNLQADAHGFDSENVDGEQYRPMFDTDAARDTCTYFQELLQYSPRGILNMSWYERARCFAEGQAAMAYCATLLAPLFELNESSPAFGDVGYLPHPHGPRGQHIAPLGGYALAIPANVAADRIDPIWTALQWLTSAQAVKLYIENGSLVSPRFSVAMDPDVQRVSPLIAIVDEMARTDLLQMWPRPPVPGISEVIAIAGEEIHDALIGAKSIHQALSNSQNRADAAMQRLGHY